MTTASAADAAKREDATAPAAGGADADVSETVERSEGGDDEEAAAPLPPPIRGIFEYLSENEKIVFKSQQIEDPDLAPAEKARIAQGIYERNRQTFLMRFGGHLSEQHLQDFESLAIADPPLHPLEHLDQIEVMLATFRRQLQKRATIVRNRRFTVMQKLIGAGEYFSETEMMKRSPAQYQEWVGQYLTAEEKRQRDSYDVRNTSFAAIMMQTMDQQRIAEMLKGSDAGEEEAEERAVSERLSPAGGTPTPPDLEEDVSIPAEYRVQWGNFDDETIACSSTARSRPPACVPPSANGKRRAESPTEHRHQDLLAEFTALMQAQFLAGNDANFDYDEVDDNSQLDNLQQMERDEEDAYFAEGTDDEEDDPPPVSDEDEREFRARSAAPAAPLRVANAGEDEDEAMLSSTGDAEAVDQRLGGSSDDHCVNEGRRHGDGDGETPPVVGQGSTTNARQTKERNAVNYDYQMNNDNKDGVDGRGCRLRHTYPHHIIQ